MFSISLTDEALEDLRFLEKGDQSMILQNLEIQLLHDPLKETKNRKSLRPNNLSAWELRIRKFRVFYDIDEANQEVTVKAIGWKEHNKLFLQGEEYQL